MITYKFKSDEHLKLYDAGKISFEEATEKKPPASIFEFVTLYQIKSVTEKFKHFVYANMFHPSATHFVVVSNETGEMTFYKYLYTDSLWALYTNEKVTVYVTNTPIA